MKKIITLFAALALGAALMGCGSGESTDAAATDTKAATPAAGDAAATPAAGDTK